MTQCVKSQFLNALKAYRYLIGPLMGIFSLGGLQTQCKFPVSCSEFAKIQIESETPLIKSLLKIVLRVLSCGPWPLKTREWADEKIQRI